VRDDQESTLRALLADVCTSVEPTSFTGRWGRAEPSRRRPSGVRVACDPTSPFDALEIRPWTEDFTGVVDVVLRSEDKPLSWPVVRERFGPFRALPGLHGPEREFAATWNQPGAPAEAVLIVGVLDDEIDTLTVRRDPL
jgi:hypothetical protein